MKVLVDTTKDSLEGLMGSNVTFYCTRYIYWGKLVGLTENYAVLENPKFVYETGSFDSKDWKTAHALPEKHWHVMLHSVESFGILK